MSQQNTPQEPAQVPEWDLADRMRKALRSSHVSVSTMADYLDVGRNTVSTWINGHIEPSTQTLRLFSLRCGVPYEWLRYGIEPKDGPDNHPSVGSLDGPDHTDRGTSEQANSPFGWTPVLAGQVVAMPRRAFPAEVTPLPVRRAS